MNLGQVYRSKSPFDSLPLWSMFAKPGNKPRDHKWWSVIKWFVLDIYCTFLILFCFTLEWLGMRTMYNNAAIANLRALDLSQVLVAGKTPHLQRRGGYKAAWACLSYLDHASEARLVNTALWLSWARSSSRLNPNAYSNSLSKLQGGATRCCKAPGR